MLRRLLGFILVGACLGTASAGCAADATQEKTLGGNEEDVTSFKATYLAKLEPKDVLDTYATLLENEIAAAQQSHPGITEVDVAGVSAFHGAAKTNVLRPGLEWYLASTGAPSIAVSEIKGALVAAVKPVVEASVVREAYEDGQWYGYVNPVKLMYREDVPRDFYVVAQKAGVEVALRDVTAPSGVDVKSLLTNAAAQWELLLPVKVSTKPTFLQLGNIFHMDLGKVVTDDKAFAEIDNFDPALLAPLKARPQSIKAAWYFTSRNLNTFGVEDHGLIFMDEHKQVWGFYLQVPIE